MMTKHIKGDDDMTYYTPQQLSPHTQNTNLELGPVVAILKGNDLLFSYLYSIKFVGKRRLFIGDIQQYK